MRTEVWKASGQPAGWPVGYALRTPCHCCTGLIDNEELPSGEATSHFVA
jgi:hypothetical protein